MDLIINNVLEVRAHLRFQTTGGKFVTRVRRDIRDARGLLSIAPLLYACKATTIAIVDRPSSLFDSKFYRTLEATAAVYGAEQNDSG